MPQTREAAHDAALVALLRTLTPERLTGVLEALGVAVPLEEAPQRRPDTRRCLECGHSYVKCRQIDEKAVASERHEWRPDRSRRDS